MPEARLLSDEEALPTLSTESARHCIFCRISGPYRPLLPKGPSGEPCSGNAFWPLSARACKDVYLFILILRSRISDYKRKRSVL